MHGKENENRANKLMESVILIYNQYVEGGDRARFDHVGCAKRDLAAWVAGTTPLATKS
jgi:hypothetical protein